jgi:hypothetical protein
LFISEFGPWDTATINDLVTGTTCSNGIRVDMKFRNTEIGENKFREILQQKITSVFRKIVTGTVCYFASENSRKNRTTFREACQFGGLGSGHVPYQIGQN